jgi:hypothetical protein
MCASSKETNNSRRKKSAFSGRGEGGEKQTFITAVPHLGAYEHRSFLVLFEAFSSRLHFLMLHSLSLSPLSISFSLSLSLSIEEEEEEGTNRRAHI